LNAEQEEQPTSLYDFIFIDQVRVKSLYAQLFTGLLSEIESLASENSGKSTSVQVGGDPFGSVNRTSSENASESSTNRIDPHDIILQDVLGKLHELNFICSDPLKAVPGNIILIQGTVGILDFGFFQNFAEILPAMLQFNSPKNQHGKKKTLADKQQETSTKQLAELFKKFASLVPWSLTVLMQSEIVTSWGGIKKEDLRADPGHLTLKYGPTLSGTWYMLALVDTIPGGEEQDKDIINMPDLFDGMMQAFKGMRESVGRPSSCMGVTPLLIFRKLVKGTC